MIRSAKALLIAVSLSTLSFAQAQVETPAPDAKAGAYYNFAMGRVYAELAQALGAFGPLRGILPKRLQVLLIVEAGDRVVGLRLQIGALDAALGLGKKEGQPPA